jgi:hypothetical protein
LLREPPRTSTTRTDVRWDDNDELRELVRAHDELGATLREERLRLVQHDLVLDTMVQHTPVAMLLVQTEGVASERVVYANLAGGFHDALGGGARAPRAARADRERVRDDRGAGAASGCVHSRVRELREAADAAGRDGRVGGIGRFDPGQIEQAVLNLLKNARGGSRCSTIALANREGGGLMVALTLPE